MNERINREVFIGILEIAYKSSIALSFYAYRPCTRFYGTIHVAESTVPDKQYLQTGISQNKSNKKAKRKTPVSCA